jgi:hypothetical protein
MPEAIIPATSGHVKDPFPQLKKVLPPEELPPEEMLSGHSGNEETPAAGTVPNPENDPK